MMTEGQKKRQKIMLAICIPLVALSLPFSTRLVVFNVTDSMPLGLYVTWPQPLTTGTIVTLKPLYGDNDVSRIKYILGPAKDVQLVDNEIRFGGITWGTVIFPLSVNAQTTWQSASKDGYFVYSPHPRSDDSRYYGYVQKSQIEGTYVPLWTFGGPYARP